MQKNVASDVPLPNVLSALQKFKLDGLQKLVLRLMSTLLENEALVNESKRLFAELDVERTGLLPVETLVLEAKAYFDSQPSTQPLTWIRGMVTKSDADMDGHLDLREFIEAVEALRRC